MCKNVAVNIDAGRDFRQFESFGHAPKDASFGHIQHGLTAFSGERPIECNLFDRLDEFLLRPLRDNPQMSILDHHFEAVGRERSREYHATGVLADVDKSAGTGPRPPVQNRLTLTLPHRSDFRHAETRQVQASTIV